jgi:hypothetical protein
MIRSVLKPFVTPDDADELRSWLTAEPKQQV